MTVIYTSSAAGLDWKSSQPLQDLHSSRIAMVVDIDRCIGCRACELHCALENDLPAGVKYLRVVETTSLAPLNGERPALLAVPVPCAHCEEPLCVDVCPTGAMQKRPDGIVFIEEAACVGCMICSTVCAYGVPQYSLERGKAVKCDFCRRRVDQGLWPACATKCSTKTMYFGPLDRLARVRTEKRIREAGEIVIGAAAPDAGETHGQSDRAIELDSLQPVRSK